jgi:hypothetical protein
MKRLEKYYPPVHPMIGFFILLVVLFAAGKLYLPALAVLWPLRGAVVAWLTYKVGNWDDGDPLSGQLLLAVMIIVLPPFGLAMLIWDLRELNVSQRQAAL